MLIILSSMMYTVTGYTIEQIKYDDNGADEDLKSSKKII